MLTIAQVLTLFLSLLFGFLTAFTDDMIVAAYSFVCFIGLGALSVALCVADN